MEKHLCRRLPVLLLAALPAVTCGGASITDTEDSDTGSGSTENVEIPTVFSHFSSAVEISSEGDRIVLRTDGVPDHGSPYFPASDPRWAAYDGDNPDFQLNPNRIAEQTLVFRIPANPEEAANKSATPLGPIGVSVNGVAIFNQYAGPNRPLTFEIDSFDQYNGHPQQTGQYHYHVEPLYVTATRGEDALIGFLLDGFPLYGPIENGVRITNADLDDYHGHVSATADYPDGIYHYHVTAEDPYLNGAGFYGVPGTVGG